MVKGTSGAGLATAVAVCGGWQAAKVFVPVSLSSSVSSDGHSLRGATLERESLASNHNSSILSFSMMGATGAVAAAAAVRRLVPSRSHALCSARQAAAVESAPPPPPPFDPASQVGATEPLGFFDPLNFCKVGDEQGFRKLRAAEVKHGRVAMMAAVGAVFQHFVQFPGFEEVPKGLGALTAFPGQIGFAVLVIASGAMEILVWKDSEGKEPGDFGNPFNLEKNPQTGEPVPIGKGPRDRELNNGRMAMISILGIMVAELATGKDAIQQFGL